MNSYNHYAFGSVVAWVYQSVAGIDTSASPPGFHEITIHPHPDARLTSARGEYESVYGKITSEWQATADGPFRLKVAIPANTTAKVILPETHEKHVTQDGRAAKLLRDAGGEFVRIGSGTYAFEVR